MNNFFTIAPCSTDKGTDSINVLVNFGGGAVIRKVVSRVYFSSEDFSFQMMLISIFLKLIAIILVLFFPTSFFLDIPKLILKVR